MQQLIGNYRIEDDCDDAENLKCAFKHSPYAFYATAIGFCLYSYGYLSAKLGYGNWIVALVTFFIGLPLCAYGIFKILETIREARQIVV